MPKAKQTKSMKPDEVPTSIETSKTDKEQDWRPGQKNDLYVVTRDGFRVSDKEYTTPDCPQVIAERDFWKGLVDSRPDGTKVEIVKYDKKRHHI